MSIKKTTVPADADDKGTNEAPQTSTTQTEPTGGQTGENASTDGEGAQTGTGDLTQADVNANGDDGAVTTTQSDGTAETQKLDESPDPQDGLNEDQSKPKYNTQNGDPRAYAYQDQRAVDPDQPGATNPNHVDDHIAPQGAEAPDAGENILAGPEGARKPSVEAKIQKGQERHLNNDRSRINPQDSRNRRDV